MGVHNTEYEVTQHGQEETAQNSEEKTLDVPDDRLCPVQLGMTRDSALDHEEEFFGTISPMVGQARDLPQQTSGPQRQLQLPSSPPAVVSDVT